MVVVNLYFGFFNKLLIIDIFKVFGAIVEPFVITLSSELRAFVAVVATVCVVRTVSIGSSSVSDVSVPWVDSSVVISKVIAWVTISVVTIAVVSVAIVIMMVISVFVVCVDDSVRVRVPSEKVWHLVLWSGCAWVNDNWCLSFDGFRRVRVMAVV